MPSIQDFSLIYARRIEEALKQDAFRRSSNIRRISFHSSNVYRETLKIREEIKALVYEGSGYLISEADQRAIIEQTIQALNLYQTFPVYDSLQKNVKVECASNDHFSELGDTVSVILRGGND